MLPVPKMDAMRRDESEKVAWDTLKRLFMEMPEEFQDYLMEEFAKRDGSLDPGIAAGLAPPKKMAQLQNLKGKLGQGSY